MTRSETRFRVDVESDVETFIVGEDYSLLRRELGPFAGTLPSGIYKFKFRRGPALFERLYEVAAGPEEVVIAPPPEKLRFESPVPLPRSTYGSDKQLQAVRESSRKTNLKRGSGSSIYVFARNAPGAPPRDLRAGLTLHALDDALIADGNSFEAGADDSSACAALNVEVAPGPYRLRMTGAEGPLEQIVVASAGWQTQVFLLYEPPSTDSPRPVLATASILMCRGGFNPDDEMLRLAESARVALALQRGTISKRLVSRLVDEKFENPMLGIYGAHAIALAGESGDLLERVLQVLESLVPGHPDVTALRIRSQSQVMIDTPPMLRTSWNAILAGNAEERVKLVPGSLASRIPATLVAGTPWLIWSSAELLRPDQSMDNDVTADLQEIEAALLGSVDIETETVPKELSGPEAALYSYLRSRVAAAQKYGSPVTALESLDAPTGEPAKFSDHRLAGAFGTSVQQVQTTVASLASKLKTMKQ